METEKTNTEIKYISSEQLDHKIASSVLSQTSIFFIALVIIIGALSFWFNAILNKVTQNGADIAKLESKLSK